MQRALIVVAALVVVQIAIKYIKQMFLPKNLPLPEFNEENLVHKAQSIEGKNIQVVECFATWCGPCRGQVPHMNRLYEQYKEHVYIVASSEEDPRQLQQFVHEQGIHYNVSSDRCGSKLMRQCFVMGIPHAFLFLHKTLVWNGHPSKLDKQLAKYTAIVGAGAKKD